MPSRPVLGLLSLMLSVHPAAHFHRSTLLFIEHTDVQQEDKAEGFFPRAHNGGHYRQPLVRLYMD